jgi:hypothetical protein
MQKASEYSRMLRFQAENAQIVNIFPISASNEEMLWRRSARGL